MLLRHSKIEIMPPSTSLTEFDHSTPISSQLPSKLGPETASIVVDDPLLSTSYDPSSETNCTNNIRKIESSGDFTQITTSTLESDGSSIDSSSEEEEEKLSRRDSASSVSSAVSAMGPLDEDIADDRSNSHEESSSSLNESFRALPSHSESQYQQPQPQQEEPSTQPPKRSVRFSHVHTRLYPVIHEDPPPRSSLSIDSLDECDHPLPLRTLDWEHTDSHTADIDAHVNQAERERKERYAEMIADHIQRVERRKEEVEKRRKEREEDEKKGVKGKWRKWKKGLGKLGKGLWKACGKTGIMMPSPSYGGY